MKAIRSLVLPALAAASALLLAACIDSEEKFVLNPDGSGKAQVEIKVVGGGISFDDEEPDPEQVARETAAGLIAGAQGVDAWAKLKYGVDDEGRSEFTGVAYFSDITRFSVGSMDGGGMKMGGGDSAWKMDRQGDVITLTYLPMGEEEAAEPGDPPADIEAAIKKERIEFRQAKTMMAGFLSEMKTTVALKLPGEIESTKLFDKKGSDVAAMSFTGTQLLEGMDKVMNDDELMRKLAREGRLGDDSEAPPELMRSAFGGDAFEITFKAGKAQFDYAAELAEAKANPPEELEALLELAKEDKGAVSWSSEDEDDEPAGDPDPDFEAFAKKHLDSLAPTVETEDGKTIQAKINSVGKMENDGKQGEVEINATFTDGDESEAVDVTVYFNKDDDGWEANGFSAGRLPGFLGEGLDKVDVVSDWVKKE